MACSISPYDTMSMSCCDGTMVGEIIENGLLLNMADGGMCAFIGVDGSILYTGELGSMCWKATLGSIVSAGGAV